MQGVPQQAISLCLSWLADVCNDTSWRWWGPTLTCPEDLCRGTSQRPSCLGFLTVGLWVVAGAFTQPHSPWGCKLYKDTGTWLVSHRAFGDLFLCPSKTGLLVSVISWALSAFEVVIFKFMRWVNRIIIRSELIKLWDINGPKNNWAVVVKTW